jgi:hypothetical protein
VRRKAKTTLIIAATVLTVPAASASILRRPSSSTPCAPPERRRTPILLSIGERDFRVPIGNTLENWSALQRPHVPSRLLVWPDAWR